MTALRIVLNEEEYKALQRGETVNRSIVSGLFGSSLIGLEISCDRPELLEPHEELLPSPSSHSDD